MRRGPQREESTAHSGRRGCQNRAIVAETPDEDPRYASDVQASVKMQASVEDGNGGVLKQETISGVTAFKIDIPFFKRLRVASIKVDVEEVTVKDT